MTDHPTIHRHGQHADARPSSAFQARREQGRDLLERSLELAAAIGDH